MVRGYPKARPALHRSRMGQSAPVSASKQSAGRRLSVITVDQVIAGASNVLISVLAARLLGVASFGLFGIVFLVYLVALGVTRALVSDPVLVHPLEAQERIGDVIGTSFMLGLAVAVVLVAGLGVRLWDPRSATPWSCSGSACPCW